MAGEAIGQGTVLRVQTAAGPPIVYATVGGVEGISVPGVNRGEIEVTALDSTAREYIADLPDMSETSFSLFIRKGAAAPQFETGQQRLETLAGTGDIVSFQIVLNTALGAITYTCSGYVKQFQLTSESRAAIKASVTIRWTGLAVKS